MFDSRLRQFLFDRSSRATCGPSSFCSAAACSCDVECRPKSKGKLDGSVRVHGMRSLHKSRMRQSPGIRKKALRTIKCKIKTFKMASKLPNGQDFNQLMVILIIDMH